MIRKGASMKKPQPIDVPELQLRHSTVDEHCEALSRAKKAWFWWYMGMTTVPWNFSLPFQDDYGRWWYQVKPGLCWPADFLAAAGEEKNTIPLLKRFIGYQHVVPAHRANSRLIINVIEDISSFGPESVPDKRRNIRTGFNSCSLEVMDRPDAKVYAECSELWRDFVGRTAWKKAVDAEYISRTWGYIMETPGVSIILGRDRGSGRVAGFLITKIIGDTAYVDTIASSTALMKTKVNDALVYAFVKNAQGLPEVKKAYYTIVSYKATLEKFKQSHGFRPVPYPASTSLMPPAGALIKVLKSESYNRMMGKMEAPVF